MWGSSGLFLGYLGSGELVNLTCESVGISQIFGPTLSATVTRSIPPTQTRYTAFFNPCAPLEAPPQCAPDASLCIIQQVEIDHEWIQRGVISYGGPIRQHETPDEDRENLTRTDANEGPMWALWDFFEWSEFETIGGLIYSQTWGDWPVSTEVAFSYDPNATEPLLVWEAGQFDLMLRVRSASFKALAEDMEEWERKRETLVEAETARRLLLLFGDQEANYLNVIEHK